MWRARQRIKLRIWKWLWLQKNTTKKTVSVDKFVEHTKPMFLESA